MRLNRLIRLWAVLIFLDSGDSFLFVCQAVCVAGVFCVCLLSVYILCLLCPSPPVCLSSPCRCPIDVSTLYAIEPAIQVNSS